MPDEPDDVDGQCNARLEIADNFGDNHATMRCELEPGHDGPHSEKYMAIGYNPVTVTWEKDCAPMRMWACDECKTEVGPARYGGECPNANCTDGWLWPKV